MMHPVLFISVFLVLSDRASLQQDHDHHDEPNSKDVAAVVYDRPLSPPFPDGLNGGRIVRIPPEETYAIHSSRMTMTPKAFQRFVLQPREISVWLPREYDNEPNNNNDDYDNDNDNDNDDSKFPVLMVQDGQNVMSDSESWTGVSWRLMGALTRLSERGLLRYPYPPVVVLVPSASSSSESEELFGRILPPRRHLEYADTSHPMARAHVDFLVQTVLPVVRSKFTRVSPYARDTFAMGSSLGGQVSMHLLVRYPHLVGGIACLSPAFSPPTLASVVALRALRNASSAVEWSEKCIYLDMGGDMNDIKVPWLDVMDHVISSAHHWNPGYWWLDTQLQPSVQAMTMALTMAGIPHVYETFPGARHNERAWSLRIHRPLMYLLGKHRSSNCGTQTKPNSR